tara:strand:- start:1066 stop:1212 length:147 start_codon:yes stop_codon:yes gene_type:complete
MSDEARSGNNVLTERERRVLSLLLELEYVIGEMLKEYLREDETWTSTD